MLVFRILRCIPSNVPVIYWIRNSGRCTSKKNRPCTAAAALAAVTLVPMRTRNAKFWAENLEK